MIKPYFLQRTFHIGCGNTTGTAFALHHDNIQYLVTAQHVVKDMTGNQIRVYYRGAWRYLPVEVIGVGNQNSDIDIAVLKPSVVLGPTNVNENIVTSSIDMKIGQRLYLLGFPLAMMGDSPYPDSPLPFVKSGVLSAVDKWHDTDFIYVDCIANHGFSGGPLIYYRDDAMPPATHVVGVMVKFRLDKDGHSNSGIGVAVDMRHVVGLINSNPNISI